MRFGAVIGLVVLGRLCGACAGADVGHASVQPVSEQWAAARQSTVPPELLRFYRPDAAHCLEARTCPFQGAEVPLCARSDSVPLALERVGQEVRLRGKLAARIGTSTQVGCQKEAPCCNQVNGLTTLQTPSGTVTLSASGDFGSYQDGFACVGDRSAVCCGFAAMGEDVIAEGKLLDLAYDGDEGARQHELYLHVTGFCRTNGVNHGSSNLAKIDASTSHLVP